jgi:predicted nucleic acid-binding protein
VAQRYLAGLTSSDYLMLDGQAHRRLIDHIVEHDITGGSAYDALVGLTAKAAGITLLTRDQRAVRTYERLRVEFEIVTDESGR